MKFLFDDSQKHTLKNFIFRSILFAGLIVYSWYMIRIYQLLLGNPDPPNHILHLIDLVFHEAGHLIFLPPVFGKFIYTLGGTIMQLLVPLTCMIALLFKARDPFGASVCLWWIGENFLDISIYMYDAQRMWLPLLGGGFGNTKPYGAHDWNYILTETGLLQHTHALATTVFITGYGIMLLSLLWGLLVKIKHFKGMVLKPYK